MVLQQARGNASWLLSRIAARLPGGRRLSAELARAERQKSILVRRLRDLRERSEADRLDEAVLSSVLPHRLAAIQSRVDPIRHARANVFAERSPSYREALHRPAPAGSMHVDINGLSWSVPAGDGGVAHQLVVQRRLPLREILQSRELAIGGVMLDIGANIGTTSIPRAVLGDVDHVYCAEPDSDNYACLVRNVVDNGLEGLVLPDRVAIGEVNGVVELRTSQSGTHHLIARDRGANGHSVPVPCVTLDSWVDALGIDLAQVRFIKCDAQGWDVRILLGASRVLAQPHIAWQIEISPSMLQRAGHDLTEACEIIASRFAHFIDLRSVSGPRVRDTVELARSMAYLTARRGQYTNLLLFAGS